jgi:hypothetical protein
LFLTNRLPILSGKKKRCTSHVGENIDYKIRLYQISTSLLDSSTTFYEKTSIDIIIDYIDLIYQQYIDKTYEEQVTCEQGSRFQRRKHAFFPEKMFLHAMY